MNTLRMALVPGVIAGVVSIFTSWLWMGNDFSPIPGADAEHMAPENNRSYVISSAIHVLACIAIATLFILVARRRSASSPEGHTVRSQP